MKIFGSRKEAIITGAIAAFFVLVALGFTVEPLVTLIVSSRTLPAGTTVMMKLGNKTNVSDALNEITSLITSHGFEAPDQAIMAKIGALADNTPINGYIALAQSQKAPPYGLYIETSLKASDIVETIRQLMARLSPSELITMLPDNTTMTEIVIDPSLIPVTHQYMDQIEQWSFSTLNPHLDIQQKPLGSAILINSPQLVDIRGFEIPISCRLSNQGIREVTYDPTRQALTSALFKSIFAYFKQYSCFQYFSTLNQ